MGLIPQPLVLTQGGAINTSSGTTSSVSPRPNTLIFVVVFNLLHTAGSANLPSLSGLGITWHQVQTLQSGFASGQFRLTVWVGVVPSVTSGALTIDCSGQSQEGIQWGVIEFPQNVSINAASPQNAIIQTATNQSSTTNTSLAVTLSSFANLNNATIGFLGKDGGIVTPGGSFTAVVANQGLDTNGRLDAEFASNNQTSVGYSWSSDATAKLMIACEVKCAFTGGGGLLLL